MELSGSKNLEEQTPLREGNGPHRYIPAGVGVAFGSIHFLITILIASVIPILQLIIGWYYKDQCKINQNIPTYLIVSGICGLILVVLCILMALTFLCFLNNSVVMSIIASCGICMNLMATTVLSIFIFIWFIIGCVWIFSVRSKVDFYDKNSKYYCQRTLYLFAFWLLIATFIMMGISCCINCFKSRKTETQRIP
ncbi:unnamed protein product [Didymodactylos carnosus]|uniref:Uncharacterized protein n=1 Tax=Didymodactylos carnosus TaxID=1234261 RepID=A0A814E4Q6_9BILA|nr:unnamed protein product [Didymodactylos carnosus]CAF1292947.1 unnamed protein product [Didymodactylos carnosus]CAF3739584.1 unnamed protein product [Didymodactylos carnosus]CAF4097807.1 unnamed protein product [Didymodactylos carnosus]